MNMELSLFVAPNSLQRIAVDEDFDGNGKFYKINTREEKDEYEVEEVPIGNVNLSVHRIEVNEEDRCGCLQRS